MSKKEDTILYLRHLYNEDYTFSNFNLKDVIDFIDELEIEIIQLLKENEQLKADYGNQSQVERDLLKDKWNKLEEWLHEIIQDTKDTKDCEWNEEEIGYLIQRRTDFMDVLNKMKEIKGKDNAEDNI